MSKPLRYAILGTVVALVIGLAAWSIITGQHSPPGHTSQMPWVAITTAIGAALLAGRSGRRCGRGCKRTDQPQEEPR